MGKAQITTFDLLIVSTILIILFAVSIVMWNTSITRIQLKENIENLEANALAISDQLIRTPGLPEDWEESVAQEYTADENTVGLWHLNEIIDDKTIDNSSYENSGDVYGAELESGDECKFNFCLGFDGEEYLNISHQLQYSLTTYTIEFWVYPQSILPNTEAHLVYKENQFYIKLVNDRQLQFYVGGVGGPYISPVNISLEKWTHVALVVEWNNNPADPQTRIKFYINNNKTFDGTYVGTPSTPTTPILVGRQQAGNYFKGRIDEIRFSDIMRKKFKVYDLVTVGLATNAHVLDRNKVDEFINLNYNSVKKLFGGYNFNFTLINLTGNVIVDNGKELKLGISPDSENIVGIKRAVLYNNEITFMNLVMWK